jgi:hypothetical protein
MPLDEMLDHLRGKLVIFWLDGDMRLKMNRLVVRLNSFGLKSCFIWTHRDPKEYMFRVISSTIVERVKSYNIGRSPNYDPDVEEFINEKENSNYYNVH